MTPLFIILGGTPEAMGHLLETLKIFMNSGYMPKVGDTGFPNYATESLMIAYSNFFNISRSEIK